MALSVTGSLRTVLLGKALRLSGRAVPVARCPRGAAVGRSVVTTTSGGILPNPQKTRFGLTMMTVVVIPFLYIGTCISKNFAALLEEHEIFVPDDDDDD